MLSTTFNPRQKEIGEMDEGGQFNGCFEGAIYQTEDGIFHVAVCRENDEVKPFDGNHVIFKDVKSSESDIWKVLERVAQERGIVFVSIIEESSDLPN